MPPLLVANKLTGTLRSPRRKPKRMQMLTAKLMLKAKKTKSRDLASLQPHSRTPHVD
jgi:hypothetical protein